MFNLIQLITYCVLDAWVKELGAGVANSMHL